MPAEEFDDALGASYRLVELLGRGATGEVWRGVDRRTDETVAAKVLRHEHVEDEALVDRFLRERSILTRLRHPNVVAVRDLVVEGDRLAIVMEHVDGGSLRDVLRTDGPMRPGLALGVTAAVLDGLAAAHGRGVLHRDVKPDNVLLSGRWRKLGPGAVKVSDFGISQILADRAGSTTGLVGTPEYMAPEQLVTGAGDPPADVYAAGILLYELLAGRTPFAGAGTGYTIAHRHVTSEPPRIPVPDRVWDVLVALLDKNPTARPAAQEAAARLRALRSDVAELPTLPPQEAPADFGSTGRPATELRGLTPPPPEGPAVAPDGDATAVPLPDLGTPGQATSLRAMPSLPPPAPTARASAPDAPRSRWRDPRAIAVLVAAALLVGGGIFWATRGPSRSGEPAIATVSVRAQQQSTTRPSGLGIAREATWEPQSSTARLTTIYSAERAPLQGPFLEVVPGGRDGCPAAEWSAPGTGLNLPSVTGLSTPCAWSVEAPAVPARGSVSVTASVPLVLPPGDPGSALQKWLESAAAATEAATTDNQVTSTAYPAQRLTDVQVVAPSGTVSGRTLKIALVPVWPSGADPLNPLFQSPPSGDPSSLLVSAAGGESGVRFSDQCSDALSISADGLVVTALAVADRCQVGARVGNFTDLLSGEFTIRTRGS